MQPCWYRIKIPTLESAHSWHSPAARRPARPGRLRQESSRDRSARRGTHRHPVSPSLVGSDVSAGCRRWARQFGEAEFLVEDRQGVRRLTDVLRVVFADLALRLHRTAQRIQQQRLQHRIVIEHAGIGQTARHEKIGAAVAAWESQMIPPRWTQLFPLRPDGRPLFPRR